MMTWPWPPSDHVAITAHQNPHTHKPRQAISKKFLTMEVEPTDEASVGQKAQVSGTCRWPRDLSLTTVAPASLLQFTSVATRIKAVPCHLLKGRLKAKLWFIDESACYLEPPPPQTTNPEYGLWTHCSRWVLREWKLGWKSWWWNASQWEELQASVTHLEQKWPEVRTYIDSWTVVMARLPVQWSGRRKFED